MNLKGVDLNLLVALEALLIEKSVTKAAERLHITQPAMSNALRRIREHFADEVLVRNGRQFELTPAAQTLLIPVQEILSDAEALLNVSRAFDPSTARRGFHLMMSDYCADILLPPVAAVLSAQAPHVKLQVTFLNNHALSRLSSGEIDICIVPQDLTLLSPDLKYSEVRREEIFKDDFVCIVSADHPLTRDGLGLDTYKKCPHVCVRFGDGTISMDDQVKRQHGLEASFVVPTAQTLPKMVLGTDLIATVPRRLLDRIDTSSISIFPCPIEIPHVIETMIWHPRATQNPSHRWLRKVIADVATNLPEPRCVEPRSAGRAGKLEEHRV